MKLSEFLKPLFSYKKYIVAEQVLKVCCGSFLVVTNSENEPQLLSEKQYPKIMLAANFLMHNEIKDSNRLLEAVEILEENGHIVTFKNSNLYQYSIQCTKKGEQAFSHGFYQKAIFKRIALIIGAPIVLPILLSILSYIKKLIR